MDTEREQTGQEQAEREQTGQEQTGQEQTGQEYTERKHKLKKAKPVKRARKRRKKRIRTAAGKHAGVKRKDRIRTKGRKPARTKNDGRVRNRDEERARIREARRKKVMIERIALVGVLVLIVVVGIGLFAIFHTSSFRISRKMSEGEKYTQEGDYEKAQASYEEVLQIDPTMVEAYRYLAENNLNQNNNTGAKEVLYRGWEQTQDGSLLRYYCTVLLNEVVEDLNADICTFEQVDKCIQVLEINVPDVDELRSKSVEILGICHERLFEEETEYNMAKKSEDEPYFINTMFFDENRGADTCQYGEYERLVRRLIGVYQMEPTSVFKDLAASYAILGTGELWLSDVHINDYRNLLGDVFSLTSDSKIGELCSCLDQAMATREYFAPMFTAFEEESFEQARDFIVEADYQRLRDAFINGNTGYWIGSASIPVNRDNLILYSGSNGIGYEFPDYDDYEGTRGIIMVSGTRELDDGVQRTTISYLPAEESADGEYKRTEYIIIYWYSNVGSRGRTNPRMNYRFEKRVVTEAGNRIYGISDWGGEYEQEFEN